MKVLPRPGPSLAASRVPLVQLRDAAHEGQPEAEAARAAIGAALALGEQVEDPRQHLGRDPTPESRTRSTASVPAARRVISMVPAAG